MILYEGVKRVLDIVLSLILLVILSPVFTLTFVSIFFYDFCPPLYSQKRVGRYRHEFTFYKFRSMVKNADKILFANKELYNQMRSGTNKVANDPRITPIGRFIRKFSIDELPQIFNVLKGDMSLVGPRALRPDELSKYEMEHPKSKPLIDQILSVSPGITGYWQVSGRSRISFDKRMEMEAEYSNKKSILFDLLIISKTPLAVLRAEGAY